MAAKLFFIRNSLPVTLSLVLFLKSGRSDHCSGFGENKIAEKQVCDDKESYIDYTAINLYSHGVPDGVSHCICKVYLQNGTNYVSVGYFTNSGGNDQCGLQVKLGNSKTFACQSQRRANVPSFNVIKFSRKSDSSPNMCLEIRSATPLTIQCRPSPSAYTKTESEDSDERDNNAKPSTKYTTTYTITPSSSYRASTSAQAFTSTTVLVTSTTRPPSSINTTTTSGGSDKHAPLSAGSTLNRKKDKPTTPSPSSTRETMSKALTELPRETKSSAVNGTTVASVVPAGEYTDTAVLMGIFVPLMVIAIVVVAFCIRYKYKTHQKGSRLLTEDSTTSQQFDTTTNSRTTEDEEATVTYNVAYGLVIPTGVDNSIPKYNDDTTVTYNVAYNIDIPKNENAKKTYIPAKPDYQTEFEEATDTYNVAYNMIIPPSFPANNANTNNTGVNPGNVYDKAKDDDLVVTYNAMYNVVLDKEANGDNSDNVFDSTAVRDTDSAYKDGHIYHEINENMQDL